jgi:hypothetical protein
MIIINILSLCHYPMVDNGRNDCVDSLVNDVEREDTAKLALHLADAVYERKAGEMSLSTYVTVSS